MKKIFKWFKKNLAIIGSFPDKMKVTIVALFVMFICFISGCNYHKNHSKCPEITTNTVIIHDTIIHNIVDTFPYYIVKTKEIIYRDTILREVDTANILRDYFAYHIYDRNWKDSLITVDLRDTVTENKFLRNEFTYKILRPQTIINYTQDNSVTYNSYLYGGLSIPINNINDIELNGLLTFPKAYIGMGYQPNIETFNVKLGVKLLSFKAKK